jgi:hypothetical protein
VDESDLRLRNLTYELFVELGRAPTTEEAGLAAGVDVSKGWQRLHDAHALVLDSAGEIRMANPFSAVPTPYRVNGRGRWWYGNCAGTLSGSARRSGPTAAVETNCADCGEGSGRNPRRAAGRRPRLPLPRPGAHWWDDIVYT